MKRFQKDCIGDIVSIADLTLSPAGGLAAFVTHRPNVEKDGYDCFLHTLNTQTGEIEQLTFTGSESSFCFIDGGDALLFPGLREQKDRDRVQNGEELTAFYRLPLAGGEARELFRLPLSVGKVCAMADNRLLLVAKHDLSRPDLTGLEGEALQKALEGIRAERDYEVCDERPYRADGAGYINKTRTRLYVYDMASGALEAVTEPHFAVTAFCVSQDGSTVYYAGESYSVAQTFDEGLYAYAAADNATHELCRPGLQVGGVAEAGGRVWFTTMNSTFDTDIWSVPRMGGNGTLELAVEEDLGFQNSGDACRGGGTAFAGHGDYLYFVKSDRHGAHLFRMAPGGAPERLSDEHVWVNHFAVEQSGRVLCAGLPAFGMMEVFAVENGKSAVLTHLNDATMQKYEFVRPQYLPFDSRDGVDLDGWVMLPPEAEQGKVPVILLIHGGPRGQYQGTLSFDAQVMASGGYAVIFCNPRGSSSRSRAFADINGRYGTVDFDDLMDFVDAALKACPQLDGDRLGVTGASYGGYMTNWMIGHTDRFKAGVAQCSISNWITMYGCCDIPWFVETTQGGTPWSNYDALWRSSPLQYADRVKTPTLFLQYMADYRCPMDQAIQMYAALQSFGVETRMVLFEGDSHVMIMRGKPSHRIRRHTEMMGWFDKHLK